MRPLTWAEWPESARRILQGFRSEAGEAMALEKNLFVEAVLPSSITRTVVARPSVQGLQAPQPFDHDTSAGPAVALGITPQLRDVRACVRRPADRLEQPRGAGADDRTHLRVGEEQLAMCLCLPDRTEPRPVCDGAPARRPGERLVHDLRQQRGLGSERGGDSGPRATPAPAATSLSEVPP